MTPGDDLPAGKKQTLTTGNDSVNDDPTDVLYNSLAYVKRLEALDPATADPSPLIDNPSYYQEVTRKVPFAEVSEADTDTATATVQTLKGELASDFASMLPVNAQGLSDNTGLNLAIDNLPATKPDETDPNFQRTGEQQIGDRILVGNNLPLRYFFEPDATNGEWRDRDYEMPIEGGQWAGNVDGRYRKTQVADIPNAGDTARNGDWEKDAVRDPVEPSEAVGGLLVVTGAGVYNRGQSFLPPPIPATMNVDQVNGVYKPVASGGDTFTVVWPDTMPMSPPYDQTGGVIPGSKLR